MSRGAGGGSKVRRASPATSPRWARRPRCLGGRPVAVRRIGRAACYASSYASDPERLDWRCPPTVPPFYQELAAQPPGSLRLLEASWWHAWDNVYFPCYQQVHRQYMAIGFVADPERAASPVGLPRAAELPLLAPGRPFRFRNFIHVSDRAALRRRGIRYVVFHKSLEAEMGVESPDYRVDIGRWLADYRQMYGPPVFEDETLLAFDVTVTR